VERVLGHLEVKHGKQIRKEFLVKWLGYEHEHNTWEPEKHLTHCENLLTDYWANVATSPQGVREKQTELIKKRKTAELERNRSVEQTAVNLQVVGRCLQDVDKVIERWTNASPQK
jgi:chromodomain protein Y